MRIQSLISAIAQGALAQLSAANRGAPTGTNAVPGAQSPDATRRTRSPASRFDTSDEVELSPQAEQEAPGQLTEEEQQQVVQLRQRDREVRAHEQAHVAAAGSYAQGGPTYEYEQGPDGRQYAVGGEVSIDTAPVSGDPEATLRKAQVIRTAANAPAEPSAQDRQVAAAAAKMEAEARQDIREQQQAEQAPSAEGDQQVAPEVRFAQRALQDATAAAASSLGFRFDAVA